ncbi:iron-sulfur cluster repair di-iron protein [Algoriphagus namhaensis]|uniref:Iron-sulfur cluster repair di-iron protein n=1 Tax=Algoriphagus namhaensis TaxID=915353 RepID=A0ABV8AS99_9BACT
MSVENLEKKEVGAWVKDDYRNAKIFKKYNIDFCCGGNKPLDTVCETKGLSLDKILSELQIESSQGGAQSIDYKSWPLDLLATYIERTHHVFVRENIPAIQGFLDKLVKVHGSRHPELSDIRSLFLEISEELLQHMEKEEELLFPEIKKASDIYAVFEERKSKIADLIAVMEAEHENAGDIFRQISQLTSNYTPPADACTTYKVTYKMLQEFEDNLHLHVHLENNILFPATQKN